jgi:hypothetical protein
MNRPMRTVAFTAAGHSAIIGSHSKTLEVTAEPAVTSRATCVIGVHAQIPASALRALRGRVRVELSCGELRDEVEGEVNPYYSAPDRWVARRSALLSPDTFLVNATRGAADLDRALVHALADRSAALEVVVRELAVPDLVVLVIIGGVAPVGLPPQLAALAEQADAVVDLAAADLRGGRLGLGAAARTVIVHARDLAEAGEVGQLPSLAGRRVRVAVWPSGPGAELLVAAGEPTHPVLYAGTVPSRAARRRELARRIEGSGLVAAVTPRLDDPAGTLDLIGRLPGHAVLLPDPSVGWGVAADRLNPRQADDRLHAGVRALERHPSLAFLPPRRAEPPLVVQPEALAAALRAAGLSGRSVRDLIGELGGDRRGVYSRADPSAPDNRTGGTARAVPPVQEGEAE